VWASVGLISPLNNTERKLNECNRNIHKINESPIKDDKKTKDYTPRLPYNPVVFSTNSLLEWLEKSYKDKKGNDLYTT